MQIVKKDLLSVRRHEGVVVHQCNCATFGKAKGVAKAIFNAFPYANIYNIRNRRDWIGTADVRMADVAEASIEKPTVINLMAQLYPGHPRSGDDEEDRLRWLKLSIRSALRYWDSYGVSPPKFFIPYGMGCHLAGGDWVKVSKVITEMEVIHGARFFACFQEMTLK